MTYTATPAPDNTWAVIRIAHPAVYRLVASLMGGA